MENEILLSIAIPTWNRAGSLQKLLENILSQVKELGGVEVCISDNNSTDNTGEVVAGFNKKYPALINYNKNKENVGFDKNMLLVIEMSKGDFIWTLGDDDSIVENGLKEIIGFFKKNNKKDTGLVVLRTESYFIDQQTGKKFICGSTFDRNKPETFKIENKDVIGMSSPVSGFMSLLIFNGKILKELIKEDKEIIEEAIGTAFIHVFLRSLMFLKHSSLNAVAFNKPMVLQEVPSYKFIIEDKFMLHYRVQKKMNNLLVSYKYMDKNYIPLIIKINNKLRKRFVEDMLVMRAFKRFNYFSYLGCLKSFFKNATLTDALLFSFVFSILFIIPPAILILLYKFLLIIRHGKKWREKWSLASSFIYITGKGDRRLNYMFHD